MQKAKLMLTGLTFMGLVALAGCSFPGVYKIDIQQGNVVSQDMIDQLRPGMTRRQVRFIMGNPLITDTFHANRWDYLYSLQPGGGARQQERISLVFDGNDQLVGLSGDFIPGQSRDEAIRGSSAATQLEEASSAEAASTPAPAVAEPAPAPGSLLEQIQQDVDEAETAPVPTPESLELESETAE
jgi:outer membrane protein assembly factor BamE